MNPHQEQILNEIKLAVHSISGLNLTQLANHLKKHPVTASKYAHVSQARGDIKIAKVGLCKILLKP